ncbi:MAG: hypothetical protein JW800_00540, partial [Candidatus Omnitrophica bacterium]|nr:hypothetical protein [Candidatus Omnitrophota bacterium]
RELVEYLKKKIKAKGTTFLRPTAGIIPRIRNRYIWNVMIKTKDSLKTSRQLKEALQTHGRFSRTTLTVDVDPI